MKKFVLSLVLCASGAANACYTYLQQPKDYETKAEKAARVETTRQCVLKLEEKRAQENQARLMREAEERREKQQLADNLAAGTQRAIELAVAREEKERLFPGRGNGGKDMLGYAGFRVKIGGNYEFDRGQPPKPPKLNAPTEKEERAEQLRCVSAATTSVLGEPNLIVMPSNNENIIIYTHDYVRVLKSSFDAKELSVTLYEGALSVSSALSLSNEIIRTCKPTVSTPSVEKTSDFSRILEDEAYVKHTLVASGASAYHPPRVVALDKFQRTVRTNESTLRKFTTCVQAVFDKTPELAGTVRVEQWEGKMHRIVWTKNWVRVASTEYWVDVPSIPVNISLFNFQLSKEHTDVLAATLRDKCSPK